MKLVLSLFAATLTLSACGGTTTVVEKPRRVISVDEQKYCGAMGAMATVATIARQDGLTPVQVKSVLYKEIGYHPMVDAIIDIAYMQDERIAYDVRLPAVANSVTQKVCYEDRWYHL